MNEILTEEQKQEALEEVENRFGKKCAEELKDKEFIFSIQGDIEELETEIDIAETKQSLNFDMFTKNLLETSHLYYYEEFNNELGLTGDYLTPFKKGIYYYVHSLRQPTITCKINRKTFIDNRKHELIITQPAGGKTTTKNFIKRLIDKELLIETTGLSHPEQLIGKMKYIGKGDNKTPKPCYGILGYKGVIYDESQELLNEKNDMYAKAQRIKRMAMDTYGNNEISKKLVDDSNEDVLSYYSKSRIMDFAHPKKLESPFFDTGSFRRYDIHKIDFQQEIRLKEITDFKIENSDYKNDYKTILDNQYKESLNEVIFSQENLDIISHFHTCLLYYLLKHKNKNAFRYGLITRYSLRDNFCKNVLILALSKNETTPSFETTLKACCDTLLFTFKSIESINELGDMNLSSDVWAGLCEKDALVCEYLLRKGALDFDSSNVSIRKFCSVIANIYGCKITQARANYYRLKKGGFIDSKQGKGESWCWLKYIPKDIKLNCEGYEPVKFWDKYFNGVGTENTILTALKTYFIDDKTFKENEGIGGVGVMGCVLSIFQDLKNKNKNNNNNIVYPHPPTSPIPLNKENILSSIKQDVEGIKTPKTKPTPLKSKKKPIKEKSDRQVQFYDAPECADIKPNHTKEDVLNWIKENSNKTSKELYEHFGVGSLKFKNELVKDKLVLQEGDLLKCN